MQKIILLSLLALTSTSLWASNEYHQRVQSLAKKRSGINLKTKAGAYLSTYKLEYVENCFYRIEKTIKRNELFHSVAKTAIDLTALDPIQSVVFAERSHSNVLLINKEKPFEISHCQEDDKNCLNSKDFSISLEFKNEDHAHAFLSTLELMALACQS